MIYNSLITTARSADEMPIALMISAALFFTSSHHTLLTLNIYIYKHYKPSQGYKKKNSKHFNLHQKFVPKAITNEQYHPS